MGAVVGSVVGSVVASVVGSLVGSVVASVVASVVGSVTGAFFFPQAVIPKTKAIAKIKQIFFFILRFSLLFIFVIIVALKSIFCNSTEVQSRNILFIIASRTEKGALHNAPQRKNHIAILKKGLADVVFCVRIKLL